MDPAIEPLAFGVLPLVAGTLLVTVLSALIALPTGVGAAIYLEEYAPDSRLVELIEINIGNLAGVPSVVYGLLGLALFIRTLRMPSGSVIVGGFTVGLLILPIGIISAQEGVASVPDSMRDAPYAMTRWVRPDGRRFTTSSYRRSCPAL